MFFGAVRVLYLSPLKYLGAVQVYSRLCIDNAWVVSNPLVTLHCFTPGVVDRVVLKMYCYLWITLESCVVNALLGKNPHYSGVLLGAQT